MLRRTRKGSLLVVSLVVLGSSLILSTPKANAAFPGANTRIYFTHELSFDLTEIWAMNPDGTGEFRVIGTNTRFPALSPDGSRLTYQVGYCCSQDIWVARADGLYAKDLTNNSNYELVPSFSADGSKILFRRYTGSTLNDEVMVMDATDGSNQTTLTNNPAYDDQPVMAADGSKIAFASNRDLAGTIDVYAMNPDGSAQTQLTTDPGNDNGPDWSPDSARIVFESDRTGQRHIFVMDADGGNETQLTFGSQNDGYPVFSPDGTQIAFESDRTGDWRIWVMDSDGSHQHQVSTIQGTRSEWRAVTSWDATMTVSDTGFTAERLRALPGTRVRWSFTGTVTHGVSDPTGLELFGSGMEPPGGAYASSFFGAGTFSAMDPTTLSTARVLIPTLAEPPSGPVGTTFTVKWSGPRPPTRFRFDVQVKPPGSASWLSFLTKTTLTSSTTSPTVGTYLFRARVRGNGAASGWSPAASFTVT